MDTEKSKVFIQNGVDVTFITINEVEILEETSIQELEQAIMAVVNEQENHNLLLDFKNVRFMSSAFLGLLVKIHKRVSEKGRELKLANISPNLLKIFEITRLDKIFDIS